MASKFHPDAKEQLAKERGLVLWIGHTGLQARTVEDRDLVKMMEVVDRRLAIPKKTKISNLIEIIYQDARQKKLLSLQIMGATWLLHSDQRKRNPALYIQKRMRGVRENMRMRRQGKTIIELLTYKTSTI